MDLNGKAALVTGGARGIGAATALELARQGADIAICDCHMDEKALAVKAEVEALGRRCLLVPADMSKPEHATRCVQETASGLGGVDVLVHCAGGGVPGGLLQITPEAWYEAFAVHVHAIFHLCRAAVPLMRRKREGAIILISSVAGMRGCLGAMAYGVVKGAVIPFTRTLARELADENIRVNCVSPGIIRTQFQDHLTPEQVKNNIENRIPLHREGQPADVARVIALLVTNEFITGESITVDGGMAMRIA